MKAIGIFFLLLIPLTGCSKFSAKPPTGELKPPIEVEIPQSFVSGNLLHVKVSLKPLVTLKANQVVLELVGISNGKETLKETRSLLEVVSTPLLNAGEVLVSDFEVNSSGLDEYKVICRWSEEGISNPPIQKDSPTTKTTSSVQTTVNLKEPKPEELGTLHILEQVLEPTSCIGGIQQPCQRNYTIKAELRNLTANSVSNISIALEIKFIPKGSELAPGVSSGPLSADEQEVKLDGLILKSGEARAVEVKIPDPLLEIPDGAFIPRIRIFHYE